MDPKYDFLRPWQFKPGALVYLPEKHDMVDSSRFGVFPTGARPRSKVAGHPAIILTVNGGEAQILTVFQ